MEGGRETGRKRSTCRTSSKGKKQRTGQRIGLHFLSSK